MLVMNTFQYGSPNFNMGLGQGYFGGGWLQSEAGVTQVAIFTFSGNSTTPGTSLDIARHGCAAVGNATRGVWGGGIGTTNTTSVYTYSGNTVAAGGSLVAALGENAAAGNSTVGVFSSGSNSGLGSATSVYTYSANTSVGGTALTYGTYGMTAGGNATVGIFACGIGTSGYLTTSLTYTYSGNTVAAGSSFSITKTLGAVAGTTTFGVFGMGINGTNPVNTTIIYTYSGNTQTAGTNLKQAGVTAGAACGNSEAGCFSMGNTLGNISPNNGTNTNQAGYYRYASNTTILGSNIAASAVCFLGATSGSPANF